MSQLATIVCSCLMTASFLRFAACQDEITADVTSFASFPDAKAYFDNQLWPGGASTSARLYDKKGTNMIAEYDAQDGVGKPSPQDQIAQMDFSARTECLGRAARDAGEGNEWCLAYVTDESIFSAAATSGDDYEQCEAEAKPELHKDIKGLGRKYYGIKCPLCKSNCNNCKECNACVTNCDNCCSCPLCVTNCSRCKNNPTCKVNCDGPK